MQQNVEMFASFPILNRNGQQNNATHYVYATCNKELKAESDLDQISSFNWEYRLSQCPLDGLLELSSISQCDMRSEQKMTKNFFSVTTSICIL